MSRDQPPDQDSSPEILKALGIAVLEPTDGDPLTIVGHPPDWVGAAPLSPIRVDDTFPFLSGFLEVAKAFWANGEPGRILSDIWVQSALSGGGPDLALRATALLAEKRRFLLIERLEQQFEEHQSALQRSRERGLDNERLERVARELSAANLQAEHAVREKSDSLAGMSHDLRTPLNAMLGFSTLLLQGRAGELNEKQRGYVGHVMQAAGHLLDLINDVLDLSKIEAGVLELRREALGFNEAAEDVMPIIAPIAAAKRIAVETAPGSSHVDADRVRLRQILYNLLSNAIKFTGEGGTISLSAKPAGDMLEVCVADDGGGIPADELESVFERYYQGKIGQGKIGQGSPLPKPGSGLGLYITRRLVEQHGGLIRVESQPGVGTRFFFTLPLTASPTLP